MLSVKKNEHVPNALNVFYSNYYFTHLYEFVLMVRFLDPHFIESRVRSETEFKHNSKPVYLLFYKFPKSV